MNINDYLENLRLGYRHVRQAGRNFTDMQMARIRYENRAQAGINEVYYALGLEAPKKADIKQKIDNSLYGGVTNPVKKDGQLVCESSTGAVFDSLAEYKKARAETAFGHLLAAEKGSEQFLIDKVGLVVGPNVKAFFEVPGIGLPSMSRLLGEIGSPYIAFPQKQLENPDDLGYKRINVDLPPYERMLSQLWSYSGVGDATRRHFPGMSQEEAMACGKRGVTAILWMMATNTIKRTGKPDKNGRVLERSPYRDVYEEASLRYSQEAYPDLRPFHLRDRKIRRVMKQILMDLWNADKKDFREAGERLGFASSLTPELKAA